MTFYHPRAVGYAAPAPARDVPAVAPAPAVRLDAGGSAAPAVQGPQGGVPAEGLSGAGPAVRVVSGGVANAPRPASVDDIHAPRQAPPPRQVDTWLFPSRAEDPQWHHPTQLGQAGEGSGVPFAGQMPPYMHPQRGSNNPTEASVPTSLEGRPSTDGGNENPPVHPHTHEREERMRGHDNPMYEGSAGLGQNSSTRAPSC